MRHRLFTKALAVFMSLLMILLAFASCGGQDESLVDPQQDEETAAQTEDTEVPVSVRQINGIDIEKYTIVYDASDVDYSMRAAEYISSEIKARTSVELDVKEDGVGTFAHEIVVGETARDISKALDADTEKSEFAIFANDAHIALEGDYFVIAAAAYFFVETYVPAEYFDSTVPKEVCIHEPIVKEAKNYIFLIGDGMGIYQTLLFDIIDVNKTGTKAYSDGEDIFYGYLLPYEGLARTNSLSGVTDSAAAGTALATGYKTVNGYVGKNSAGTDVRSLTELASTLGKSTAVMSTEAATGATPASFSAHASSRNDSSTITASQTLLKNTHNTVINCGYNYYTVSGVEQYVEGAITKTLSEVSKDSDGFFLMYEEAHIDKHCHNKDMISTFDAVVRFNQAIGLFMEYAFYNPDTFVLITADHETGGLLPDGSGIYSYSHGNHSAHYVPVFTFGVGGELFDGVVIENTQIPKTFASLMGVNKFGDPSMYPSLAS